MRMSWRARACLVVFLAGIICTAFSAFSPHRAQAAQITSRSLTLQAGATDDGSKPSGVVKHLFSFTPPSATAVASIEFLYCTTASGTCTTPTGLSTTSATITGQTGVTGWTLTNTTNGAPYLTRGSAIAVNTAVTYQLSLVTNPSGTNEPFYARISTFVANNATGSAIDTGVVAASTATQIVLTGTMPESLIFCSGGTITTLAGIPNCASATSGIISFNQLFSPATSATSTSQLAASTNAISGYAITVTGPTLTSGSNTIPALTSLTAAAIGNSEFGLNLVANTTAASTPAVGAAVAPSPNGTTLRGQASTGYSTADSFKFVPTGDTIARSDNTVAGPTNSQIYTVSYLVNVAGGQPAGDYVTTLTYVCTATF